MDVMDSLPSGNTGYRNRMCTIIRTLKIHLFILYCDVLYAEIYSLETICEVTHFISADNGETSTSVDPVLPPAEDCEDSSGVSSVPSCSSSPRQPVSTSSTQSNSAASAVTVSASSNSTGRIQPVTSTAGAAAPSAAASSSDPTGDTTLNNSTATDGAKSRQLGPDVSTSDPLPPG